MRHLAERQRELGRILSLDERLETVTTSAKEMIQPTVYGQAIIILVYVPLLTFTGVEGKTFMPMAMTVIIALATAFVLSLTFVPAMVAIAVTGRVQEKENLFVRGLKALYQPALARAIRSPVPVIAGAVLLFAGASLLFLRLGQEFTPTLDEKNIVMEVKRIPSTSLSQSQSMQLANETMAEPFSTGRLRLLAHRHSRPRRRSDAAERVRHVHHLEAARSVARSRPVEGGFDPRTRYRSIETARQQDRLLAANPDAFQRADRRGAGGFGGQGVR